MNIPWVGRCRLNSHFRVESLWAYRSRCDSSVEPLRRHASTSSTARHLQQRYIISWRNIDVSKKKQKIAIGFTQCYWASRLLSWRWLMSLKVSQCFRNEGINFLLLSTNMLVTRSQCSNRRSLRIVSWLLSRRWSWLRRGLKITLSI